MLRLIISQVVIQIILTNVRTGLIIAITSGMTLISLQVILSQQHVNIRSIGLYKQLLVQRNALVVYEKIGVTGCLAGGFFLLSAAIIGIEIGFLLMNPILIATASLLGIIFLGFIVVILKMCRSINDRSLKLLYNWRVEAGSRFNKGLLLRLIRSFRTLSVPAGEVGIVNKELEINYFAALLINTVNLLMGMKEFIT